MAQGSAKVNTANPGWQVWVPTYVNITVGNGIVTARYTQIGTTVHFWYQLVLGSTSSIDGSTEITLPVNASADPDSVRNNFGQGTYYDTSTNTLNAGGVSIISPTNMKPREYNVSGSLITQATVSTTSPFTWDTGDELTVQGTYETATSVGIVIGRNNDHGGLSGLSDWDHQIAAGSWRLSGSQTVSNSTNTTVIFNSEVFETDPGSHLSMNLSTGILTVNTAGVYIVTGSIDWAGDATQGRLLTQIIVDGNNRAADERSSPGNQPIDQSVSAVVNISAGHEVLIRVFQNSGGNQDITSGAPSNMTIARLG